MCLCAYLCENIRLLHVDAHEGQKKSDYLMLELQMVVSHLMWVLGTEFWASGTATSSFNC